MNETHGLGRIPAPDERDNAFAMLTMTAPLRALPEYRYWDTRYWGDQGSAPQCVGFAWAHWLEMGPVGHSGAAPIVDPTLIYREAQWIDEWPGQDYDGTSVRAGAKVLQTRGFVSAYLWAFDAATVMDAVLGVGPVVVGTWWYDSMFTPDSKGFIRDDGRAVGGHAYVIDGANRRHGLFRMRNSWGRSWGVQGRALIEGEVLDRLIQDQGEACLAVEVRSKQ